MAVVGVACGETTRPIARPNLDPTLAAGTYVLEAVSGRGPASGTFVLAGSGEAERRVQYIAPSWMAGVELVAVGTFRLYADSIEFAFREDAGRSSYDWTVRGVRSAERFSIRHPDPADGPDIVETYRRQ